MRTWHYTLFFLLGISVALGVASFQSAPGYMDADYYFAGGLRLATGHGFSEPFLWNYLDDPEGIPHPSHAYWMPLASLVAAAGMKIAGAASFSAARLGFLLLAGMVPPITATLAYSLSGDLRLAKLAGLLAVFPGFYLPFLTTTDTFGIYMVLGGLFFLLIRGANSGLANISIFNLQPTSPYPLITFSLGLIAGLMHLARADGVLWLVVALVAVFWGQWTKMEARDAGYKLQDERSNLPLSTFNLKPILQVVFLVILGYLFTMGFWMVRNWRAFGSPLSPGGARVLWLVDYDDLYIYPASMLTPERWWQAGWDSILGVRLWSFGQNLQTALAVEGEIFLAPLILAGAWKLRHNLMVKVGALTWGLAFIVMTLVFPLPGARGGLFHSGAAVQPLLWALAPVGLDSFLDWGARRRGWNQSQAWVVFGAGLVGLVVMVTALINYPKVIGSDLGEPAWNRSQASYKRLEQALLDLGAKPNEVVMVNNAPGYYVAANRPAISVPDGDEGMSLAAVQRYRAQYLLLEANHPGDLEKLYQQPGDHQGLEYLMTVEGTHIFMIESGWESPHP